MKEGNVFDIQRFSTHDGPGIRTTVFMKGCPLSCLWCHNPESQNAETELFFNKSTCINCKACDQVCPYENAREILACSKLRLEKCGSCQKCSEVCPTNTIESIGKTYSSDEIVFEAIKDKAFYDNSGGGVTLSGGEPMYQVDFTTDILKKLKEKKIHTAIETSGFAKTEFFLKVVPWVDLFLWDVKITDEKLHKKFTGVPFKPILENLKRIDQEGAKTLLRLIIIPEVNMTVKHYESIAEICAELKNVQAIELLPYHEYGNSKYGKLGHPQAVFFRQPSPKDIELACASIHEKNSEIKIIH